MIPAVDQPHDGSVTNRFRQEDRILGTHGRIVQTMDYSNRNTYSPGLSDDIMPLWIRLLLPQPGRIDTE